MSAMIANRFKMRSDVRTYSLAGHACASAIIVVELAQQLLKVGITFHPPYWGKHPSNGCLPWGCQRSVVWCLGQASKGKVALVVLHENCTAGFSRSNVKACCAANVLFRLNGAALVLTNRHCTHAQYSLVLQNFKGNAPSKTAQQFVVR